MDEQIDLMKIEGDDRVEAFEAAKRRIVNMATPEFIQKLIDIATDTSRDGWTRSAAIYVLGFVDHGQTSEPFLWKIAGDLTQNVDAREHAEEALYQFAQYRRVCGSANGGTANDQYEDQSFEEWMAEQIDLPTQSR